MCLFEICLAAMNTLLNIIPNDQHLNTYESESSISHIFSENTNIHNSPFSTPRPVLSASLALLSNDPNNFAAEKAFILNIKSFKAYHSCDSCMEEGTFRTMNGCHFKESLIL